MPRVPRPDELPRAALEPANQPAQINIGVASRIGESGRAMGNAIAAIGGAFGEVAGRIGQAHDNAAESNARLEWLKGDQTIQDETRQNAGEDGAAWQTAPERYKGLNDDIAARYPMSPDRAQRFNQWRDTNTFNRGVSAAREYQGAQRNQFLRGFDQDVSGLEERIGNGEVDPTMFGQHYEALTGKLGSMNRTVMSQAEIEAKTRELQSRLVGATDRYLAAKDPAERDRFWGQVRGGRFEIDENTKVGPQSGIMLPDGKEGPSGIPAATPGTPGVVTAVTSQPYRTFNSQGYGERTTGQITVNGRTYEFVNGGTGRGSIPLGEYGIKRFTSGGQRAAEGFQYRKDAFELTDVRDDAPGTKGQAPRQGLLIHDGNRGVTAGCIGIKGDFKQFQADLNAEMQKNGGKFPKLQLGAPQKESSQVAQAGATTATDASQTAVTGKASPIAETVTKAAEQVGMEPAFLQKIADIESSSNPNKQTGSYKGLFQLSQADFTKYGGKGSITDPEQNALAGANKFADLNKKFTTKFDRDPTPGELYLMHQQGVSGAFSHFSDPDKPAWQNMAQFGSEKWAKQAVWGNLTPEAKKQFGSVENVTSKQFTEFWSNRVEGGQQTAPAAQQVADAGGGVPANDNAGETVEGGEAAAPTDDNDPGGSYPVPGSAPVAGTQKPGEFGATQIPMGRLAPGQVFTVNTPRGPIEVRSEWINALPQRAREQMSRQAGEQYRSFERGRQSVAKGMIEDGEVNVALHGKPSENYDVATVRAAFARDPETLRKHSQRMAIAKGVYEETANFANMSSDEIVTRMGELDQKYLAEGSTDASTKKIMDLVVKKTDALLKQRETDPAGAVDGSQEVRSVREKLIGGNPRNKLDSIALIQARLMAQTRLDIPEQAQSPLTRRELLTIAPSLRGLEPGSAAESIEKTYGMIRERYGDKFAPMILRKAIDTTVKQRGLHDSYAAMLSDIVERENTMGPPIPPGYKPPAQPGMVERLYQMLPSMPSPKAIGNAIGLGGGSTPAAEPAPTYPRPNDAAINALKKNPSRAADFDAQFGPGSAEKAIPGLNRLIKLEQLK